MSDLSWLNPTPYAIAVYASQPPSPVATQHSLPSGRYSLTWGRTFTGRIAPTAAGAGREINGCNREPIHLRSFEINMSSRCRPANRFGWEYSNGILGGRSEND